MSSCFVVDQTRRTFEIKVIIHASIDVLICLVCQLTTRTINAIIMHICFSFIHDNDVDNLNMITRDLQSDVAGHAPPTKRRKYRDADDRILAIVTDFANRPLAEYLSHKSAVDCGPSLPLSHSLLSN